MPSQFQKHLKTRSTWESIEAAMLLRQAVDQLLPHGLAGIEDAIAQRLAKATQSLTTQLAEGEHAAKQSHCSDKYIEDLRAKFADDYDKAEKAIRADEEARERDDQSRFAPVLDRLATMTAAEYMDARDNAATALGIVADDLDQQIQNLRLRLPGGPPLNQRPRFPDALDAWEIADLWTDDRQGRDGMIKILLRAAHNGELTTCGQTVALAQPEPSYVGEVLQKHIADVTRELRGKIDHNIGFLRNAVIKKVEKDLTALREELRDVLEIELSGLRAEIQGSDFPHGARPGSGLRRLRTRGLWASMDRPPIPGGRGVGFDFKTQEMVPLIHRDAFREWLEKEGEWPVSEHRHLGRWWTLESRGRTKKTASEKRAAIFDRVVSTLLEQTGPSLNRWSLAVGKRELFELCQGEDPHLFQSFGTFKRWWQEDVRKRICRTPHDS